MGNDQQADQRALYIISVAAELAGVHPQTLRIYERKGLIEPSRTEGRSRRYSDRDIALLQRIQELTNDGVSLAGVRKILELEAELERAARSGSPRSTPRSAAAHEAPRAAVRDVHRSYRRDLVPVSRAVRADRPGADADPTRRNKLDSVVVNFGVPVPTLRGRCMPLDPNKFTRKTGEALGAAQALARDLHHSQVTPEHLLAALLGQPESVVLPVLERIGVSSQDAPRPGRRRARPRAPGLRRDRPAGAALARRVPRARGGRRASAPTSATTTSPPSTCSSP